MYVQPVEVIMQEDRVEGVVMFLYVKRHRAYTLCACNGSGGCRAMIQRPCVAQLCRCCLSA